MELHFSAREEGKVMRHKKKGRKFGRERNQRRALLKSMASSFFMLGRIQTTLAKAKELRPYVERVLTRGKKDTVATRRLLALRFSPRVVKKIIEQASLAKNRAGGYTRIVSTGIRPSDGAKMGILELVN